MRIWAPANLLFLDLIWTLGSVDSFNIKNDVIGHETNDLYKCFDTLLLKKYII